jgi:hypothetical protein
MPTLGYQEEKLIKDGLIILTDEEHEEWVHIVSCLHRYGICTILEVLAGKADGKVAPKFAGVVLINIIFQLGLAVHVVLLLLHRTAHHSQYN